MRSSAIFAGLFRTATCSLLAHRVDGQLHQIPHHGFHIAAHIAHLGELGGLHLVKGRIGQQRQAPGDFGFAHARGADQDDVFGSDFIAQLFGDLLARQRLRRAMATERLALSWPMM
jgi:hypothetical protein